MPRKEVKDPWSVSPLFCERYLIKGDIVLSTIGIRENIHSQVARVCYVWKTKSSSCSSIFFYFRLLFSLNFFHGLPRKSITMEPWKQRRKNVPAHGHAREDIQSKRQDKRRDGNRKDLINY